jgi:hypothetical protein
MKLRELLNESMDTQISKFAQEAKKILNFDGGWNTIEFGEGNNIAAQFKLKIDKSRVNEGYIMLELGETKHIAIGKDIDSKKISSLIKKGIYGKIKIGNNDDVKKIALKIEAVLNKEY